MEDTPTVPGDVIAGRYIIERELGRGGAAIVFLARDNRQERQVALKVLHRELGQAIGAKRFLREIKHSSALHHPHLLSIHESGESDGLLYYVMPFMRDGSLRIRIAKEKQLAVDESLRITRQVGEALSYAHAQGIVHRDIKPDNVLFSADHACLADFGIARAVDSVAADTLTSTGLVVGTPAYMSPEQASGEREVDARSDQYSLACLLYEMITGLPPFIGATMQSVISQRFTQPPPSMRVHRPSVPDHVERAVKRALAVVPADRYPSVRDFVAAIYEPGAIAEPTAVHGIRRRWFAVGAAATVVTLAVMAARPGSDWVRGALGANVDTAKFVVLPFLSEADPSQGERVAQGLYSALSRWDGLPLARDIAVRDQLSAQGGKVATLSEAVAAARKLGAGRLVWGRVTTDGGVARVSANLYDVAGRLSLNEQTATSETGLFGDSALRTLANALIVTSQLPAGEDDGQSGTTSFAAWQAYTRAAAALSKWRLEVAEHELKIAVESDPDYALAQFRLAQVASWLRPDDQQSWTVNAARAVAFRAKLRERDAARAEALLAFGRRDYATACERYRALVRSDTLDAVAWFSLGGCLRSDNIVLPDRKSASDWRFRASWHSAGAAFLRAFAIDPQLHAIPRFDWIRQVFPIYRNQIRQGFKTVEGPAAFGARPVWAGDTVAYTPYPMPDFDRSQGADWQARVSRALSRNSDVLLGIATSWTKEFSGSAEAFLALALAREHRGELGGSALNGGALPALRKARALAGNTEERLATSESEVRVLLKLGKYSEARELADSVLAMIPSPTRETWKPVARLAGLTGKASVFADALEHYWADHATVSGLDPSVAKAAGDLLAAASLGICAPAVATREDALRQLIQTRVQPERQTEVRERVVDEILSYRALCTGGKSMVSAQSADGPILRAQTAFARGNRVEAQSILATLQRTRASRRPGDTSLNRTVREVALYAQLGDSGAASRILDATLEAAPTISASILQHPLEYAMFVRLMIMGAEGAAGRDQETARRWAGAVATLWAGADPALAQSVSRMSRLSRTGSP